MSIVTLTASDIVDAFMEFAEGRITFGQFKVKVPDPIPTTGNTHLFYQAMRRQDVFDHMRATGGFLPLPEYPYLNSQQFGRVSLWGYARQVTEQGVKLADYPLGTLDEPQARSLGQQLFRVGQPIRNAEIGASLFLREMGGDKEAKKELRSGRKVRLVQLGHIRKAEILTGRITTVAEEALRAAPSARYLTFMRGLMGISLVVSLFAFYGLYQAYQQYQQNQNKEQFAQSVTKTAFEHLPGLGEASFVAGLLAPKALEEVECLAAQCALEVFA